MKTRSLQNLCLLVASLLFWIFLIEFVLRILPTPLRDEFLNHQFSRRHPSTAPVFGSHPTLGKWSLPNTQGIVERREYRIHVHINTKGLRGPEKDYPKPPGKFRILFLGDSFTYGTGAEENETFVHLVEQIGVSRVDAINGGAPGSSTADEFRFLSLEGYKYSPDLIVLCFFQNDVDDNFQEALNTHRQQQSPPGISLVYKALGKINVLLDQGLYGRSALYSAVKYLKKNYLESYRVSLNEFQITRKHLEEMREFAGRKKIPLAMVYIPRREELRKSKEEHLAGAFLEQYAKENQIPLLNLWKVFRERSDALGLYFPLDTHVNAKGHLIVAGLICEFVKPLMETR